MNASRRALLGFALSLPMALKAATQVWRERKPASLVYAREAATAMPWVPWKSIEDGPPTHYYGKPFVISMDDNRR